METGNHRRVNGDTFLFDVEVTEGVFLRDVRVVYKPERLYPDEDEAYRGHLQQTCDSIYFDHHGDPDFVSELLNDLGWDTDGKVLVNKFNYRANGVVAKTRERIDPKMLEPITESAVESAIKKILS